MAAVLAATRYSRGGFNPCLALSATRVMIPDGSTFHMEPVTIVLYMPMIIKYIKALIHFPHY